MMSVSPPKEPDVEQGDPSPDNSEHMDRGDPEAQARELAFEFEVKEQDRWLPIANGWFSMRHHVPIESTYIQYRRNCLRSAVNGVASGQVIRLAYPECCASYWSLKRPLRSAPASLFSSFYGSLFPQPVGGP